MKPRTNLPEIVEIVGYDHCLVGHYSAADCFAHDGFELELELVHCYYLSQPVSLFHTNVDGRSAKYFNRKKI